MIESIVEKIYDTVIFEGVSFYKKMFEATDYSEFNEEYWIKSIELFRTLSSNEKLVFYEIIRNIIEDSVAHTLGVLDGATSLAGGGCFETDIKIDGIDTEHMLLELFLSVLEEKKK